MIKIILTICLIALLCSLASGRVATLSFTSQNLQASQTSAPDVAELQRLNREIAGLYKAKQYVEAETAAKRAVEIAKRILPPNSEGIHDSLENLGAIYLAQAKFSDSKATYGEALAMLESKHGADSVTLVPTLEQLAIVNFNLKQLVQAEALLLRALVIREKTHGRTHAQVAASLERLANFYEVQRDYAKAESYLRRAIANYETTNLNTNELQTARVKLATILLLDKREAEADEILNRIDVLSTTPTDVTDKRIVSAGVLNGKVIRKIEPHYPASAKARGAVNVQVTLDERGKVVEAKAVSGHPQLRGAAQDAAKKWRFSPTTLEGKLVKVTGVITFNFALF